VRGENPWKMGLFWDFDEEESIEVGDSSGCITIGEDVKALFVIGVVDEEAAAIAGVVAGFIPKALTDEGGDAADEDTRFEFQEPAGEFSTQ